MTPDELNAIDDERDLFSLLSADDMDAGGGFASSLNWLAKHATSPSLWHSSGAWVARSFLQFLDEFGLPDQVLSSFTSWSPWLALLKLVAAVQLHKRGELEL